MPRTIQFEVSFCISVEAGPVKYNGRPLPSKVQLVASRLRGHGAKMTHVQQHLPFFLFRGGAPVFPQRCSYLQHLKKKKPQRLPGSPLTISIPRLQLAGQNSAEPPLALAGRFRDFLGFGPQVLGYDQPSANQSTLSTNCILRSPPK